MIDASAAGALMKKTTDQAYEILEDAATNTNQWPRDRITPVKAVGGIDNEVLCNTPKCTLVVFDIFRVFCNHHLNVSQVKCETWKRETQKFYKL